MLISYSLDNDSEMSQWDNFVKSHPEGSPFHHHCWLRTLRDTYSFKPLLYVNKDDHGNIVNILPFFLIKSCFSARLVSLPFSDYGGPLFNDHDQGNASLAHLVTTYKDQVRYIELRNALHDSSGLICHNYYKRHVLELSHDPADLIKMIDKRTIHGSIKKSQKSGVTISEENNLWGLGEFYRLNRLTRKKHGVPCQSVKFFENLFEQMIRTGTAALLVAVYGTKVIAAGIFFRSNGTVYYKYNASDPEYLSLKCPNHLMTWHAIEQACLQGYKFFDFGRTSPDNSGLMRYKKMWGARELDLPYYFYPQIKGATSKEGSGLPYRILTKAWRLLPDSILSMVEPTIFKHMA